MRAHPLPGWDRALHPAQSPCRIDKAKGVRQHRCSRHHAELVDGYRLWRHDAEAEAERVTSGYETELAEYWRDHDRPTFRRYLQGV